MPAMRAAHEPTEMTDIDVRATGRFLHGSKGRGCMSGDLQSLAGFWSSLLHFAFLKESLGGILHMAGARLVYDLNPKGLVPVLVDPSGRVVAARLPQTPQWLQRVLESSNRVVGSPRDVFRTQGGVRGHRGCHLPFLIRQRSVMAEKSQLQEFLLIPGALAIVL